MFSYLTKIKALHESLKHYIWAPIPETAPIVYNTLEKIPT
jgi:hypothetical protein